MIIYHLQIFKSNILIIVYEAYIAMCYAASLEKNVSYISVWWSFLLKIGRDIKPSERVGVGEKDGEWNTQRKREGAESDCNFFKSVRIFVKGYYFDSMQVLFS